jgi:hypothetical protein
MPIKVRSSAAGASDDCIAAGEELPRNRKKKN